MALAADAFAGLYLNGFTKDSKVQDILIISAAISIVNAVMATIGMLMGDQINTLLEEFSTGLAIGVFFLLGAKLVIKSFKPKFQEMTWELHKPRIIVGYAFALGISSFLAGIAISTFDMNILTVLWTFMIVFFVVSVIAILTGKISKKFFLAARLEIAGGLILTGGAIYFLIKTFGIIQ